MPSNPQKWSHLAVLCRLTKSRTQKQDVRGDKEAHVSKGRSKLDVHSPRGGWRCIVGRFKSKRVLRKPSSGPNKDVTLHSSKEDLEHLRIQAQTYRDANKARWDLELELHGVDWRIDYFNDKVSGLDRRIGDLCLDSSLDSKQKVEDLRKALHMIQGSRNRLEERRQGLRNDLSIVPVQCRTEPQTLEILEGILTENAILLPRESPGTLKEVESDARQAVQRIEQILGSTDIQSQEGCHRIRRSPGSDNLRNKARSSQSCTSQSPDPSPLALSPKEAAEMEFRTRRLYLGQWEIDFEERQERFDEERYELQRGRAEGSRKTTLSELDRKHILETQKLARALDNAEQEFYAAKEAAMAAGVDFGSEAESGFASRPDDGYDSSFEAENELSVDRHRINQWLACLPEPESQVDGGVLALSDSQEANNESAGDDGVELESVDLCDTRSAKVEGPWRRRIDKWRSMQEEMRQKQQLSA